MQKNMQIFSGSFVTAWGRRTLMNVIHQVPGRVLYVDTDSIIYIRRPGMRDPVPTGRALGQLKSELPPGTVIRRWGCTGLKGYRFEYGPFAPAAAAPPPPPETAGDSGGAEMISDDNPPSHFSLDQLRNGIWKAEWKAKGMLRTAAMVKAMDGDLYQALIECRLEELSRYYDNLEESTSETTDGEGPALEHLAVARRLFEEISRQDHQTGNRTRGRGLLLPNPVIRRSFKRAQIWNDNNSVKLIRLTADKRVFAPSAVCETMPSLPFGWRLGDFSGQTVLYDEKSQKFSVG